MSDIELPELPNPDFWDKGSLFSTSQMHAYARAAVEVDRLKFEQALIELDNEPVGQQSSHNDAHYYGIFVDKIRRILRGRKG